MGDGDIVMVVVGETVVVGFTVVVGDVVVPGAVVVQPAKARVSTAAVRSAKSFPFIDHSSCL